MAALLAEPRTAEARYRGLRMTADEYLGLEDDGSRYELIDGVVSMSPSPTPAHQKVAARLVGQIGAWLDQHPVGEVFVEVDVHLGTGPNGGDLVYRPDIVFTRTDAAAPTPDRIAGAPHLVVEVVSASSRRYDRETKKNDYERCGVLEYWIIDPERREMTFYVLQGGRLVEVMPSGDGFTSVAIPGFVLDLERARRTFAS